jgi:hypothetical protein
VVGVGRIVAGHSIDQVLSKDLSIPLWIPLNFISYSHNIVRDVAKDYPDLGITKVLEIIGEDEGDYAYPTVGEEDLVAVNFKLSAIMMYQQLDRRLDE